MIMELKDLSRWLHSEGMTVNAEAVEWATEEIEELTRPPGKPRDCLCKSKPVVIEHLEQDNWLIGCPQAFFRRDDGAPECKKLVIMRAIGRDNAVASWNELIRRHEGEFTGQL